MEWRPSTLAPLWPHTSKGTYDPDLSSYDFDDGETPLAVEPDRFPAHSFAPASTCATAKRRPRGSLLPHPPEVDQDAPSSIGRIHNAWSTAVNSRLGRADNARFLEHFRYIIVASQLLSEYLDQGSLQGAQPQTPGLDGAGDESGIPSVKSSLYGAAATAVVAFALVYLIHWARSSQGGFISKGRVALAVTVFAVLASLGYAYIRRQWLKFLRRHAVGTASTMTANWQAFEMSSSSALAFVQEVELVSKGYKLSIPLPPVSRIEENGPSRRCGRLRKVLHNAYATLIPTCIEACATLRTLIDEDDLERYFEVYDVNAQDAKEASGEDALGVLEDDPESLKSLRLLSYRASVLRRVTLCSLMALEADGGKPDFKRWRRATEVIEALSSALADFADKLRHILSAMETINLPLTPVKTGSVGGGGIGGFHSAAREKMRGQVRKISMLSSGIRGLQAKMQILREETNKALGQQSEDLTDLGPSLMAQYESIGVDLRELMQACENGKAVLQSNIHKHEHRISLASTSNGSGGSMGGIRSPVSSLGGLTAVEEGGGDGTLADALKVLNGGSSTGTGTGTGTFSNRSSLATTPSDEEQVFEAVALPRQRQSQNHSQSQSQSQRGLPTTPLTREERVARMQEERERQALLRAKRESNTHMLRELETVMKLRPRARARTGGGSEVGRVTSI
ncbi:hypothetical protein B0A55_04195 [Friedmanniomyces simplex]|uniref:Vezatin n=1 Tax=Friedmanniomyces simplex TaxID=329884 RepID=A0A4U0XJ11_9PEZI|nr:hypothetical protein B0A55_04195 [Friedmanniomyces simplex]